MVEIYNEQVRDLLSNSGPQKSGPQKRYPFPFLFADPTILFIFKLFMYWHTTMHINSHYMYQRLGIYHWGLVDCYPFILKQLFLPSIYFCLK